MFCVFCAAQRRSSSTRPMRPFSSAKPCVQSNETTSPGLERPWGRARRGRSRQKSEAVSHGSLLRFDSRLGAAAHGGESPVVVRCRGVFQRTFAAGMRPRTKAEQMASRNKVARTAADGQRCRKEYIQCRDPERCASADAW